MAAAAPIVRPPAVEDYLTDGKRLMWVVRITEGGAYILQDCCFSTEDPEPPEIRVAPGDLMRWRQVTPLAPAQAQEAA